MWLSQILGRADNSNKFPFSVEIRLPSAQNVFWSREHVVLLVGHTKAQTGRDSCDSHNPAYFSRFVICCQTKKKKFATRNLFCVVKTKVQRREMLSSKCCPLSFPRSRGNCRGNPARQNRIKARRWPGLCKSCKGSQADLQGEQNTCVVQEKQTNSDIDATKCAYKNVRNELKTRKVGRELRKGGKFLGESTEFQRS